MIFNELYSAYYNAVAAILKDALQKTQETGKRKISEIVNDYAFGESFITIEKSLQDGSWPLLRDGKPVIDNPPAMPLTLLEKRWLKAVSLDPRIRLFGDTLPEFPDVEPLFRPGDFTVFDRYADGDDYEDENYVRRFRLILHAIQTRTPVGFNVLNRHGKISYFTAQPEYLEYSEKDDKFRVINSGCRYGEVVNLARIVSCKESDKTLGDGAGGKKSFMGRNSASAAEGPVEKPAKPFEKTADKISDKTATVVLEVTDERKALERVLLHFAHFSKEAERLDTKPDSENPSAYGAKPDSENPSAHGAKPASSSNRYRVTIEYDPDDETEMVTRVLSFGPLVKVTAPDRFAELIKERLLRQKQLLAQPTKT